ncbi:MAG: hydrogenase maturation nickel metallochaperone HypA [Gemmataceae bacterium]|nr:hydrogenase maturation nickel metallochaperone HypA [Gemmataceae bacterium]
MHEAGLAQAALDAAAARARERGAARVYRMTLRVGDLSGVVPEALRFALEALSPGTKADGAAFDIRVVPVECHCPACDRPFRPADIVYACPDCGRLSADVRQGHELELVEVEVS